jgi:hypothetical protein
MPTQAFIRDRKRTHIGQDYVAGKLTEQGFDVRVVKDGFFPDYDIIALKPGIRLTAEVKTGYQTIETWNLCLEIEAPSHSKAAILFYVVMDGKKPVEALFCPLRAALDLALAYPRKGPFGEHGEVSDLVQKNYFVSQIETRRL